jgi:hypothetical protein
MVWKPEDIRELMQQDQARGKRRTRPDREAIRRRARIRSDMKELLELRDAVTFVQILINDYGMSTDSECYKKAVKIWTEYQTKRSSSER